MRRARGGGLADDLRQVWGRAPVTWRAAEYDAYTLYISGLSPFPESFFLKWGEVEPQLPPPCLEAAGMAREEDTVEQKREWQAFREGITSQQCQHRRRRTTGMGQKDVRNRPGPGEVRVALRAAGTSVQNTSISFRPSGGCLRESGRLDHYVGPRHERRPIAWCPNRTRGRLPFSSPPLSETEAACSDRPRLISQTDPEPGVLIARLEIPDPRLDESPTEVEALILLMPRRAFGSQSRAS